jgi:hypothetical protein
MPQPLGLVSMDIFDLVFVLCAVAFNLLIVGIFIATKKERPELRKVFGVAFVSLGIPFAIVFIGYLFEGHDLRTMVAFGFILLYIAVELLLDYILKIDFRKKLITHVPYIALEYIALFGLIGISFSIDRTWGWIVSILFWAVIGSLIYLYWGKGKQPVHPLR